MPKMTLHLWTDWRPWTSWTFQLNAKNKTNTKLQLPVEHALCNLVTYFEAYHLFTILAGHREKDGDLQDPQEQKHNFRNSDCVQLCRGQKRANGNQQRNQQNWNKQLYSSAPLFAPVDEHRMVRALERRSTYLEASSMNRRLMIIWQISDTSVDHLGLPSLPSCHLCLWFASLSVSHNKAGFCESFCSPHASCWVPNHHLVEQNSHTPNV